MSLASSTLIISLASLLLINILSSDAFAGKSSKEVSRKSIVFDIKTPKVFYCIQEKQSDLSKTIVKAKPLEKLCEFEGKLKPKNLPSDCYNDVDETEFACEEKKRFMLRLDSSQQQQPPQQQNDLEISQLEDLGDFDEFEHSTKHSIKKKSGKKF